MIRASNEGTDHNRFIMVTGLEATNLPNEMEIQVGYRGDGNASKGVLLDNVVIPHILSGFKAIAALKVILLTTATREMLQQTDLKAYEQALDALQPLKRAYETLVKSGGMMPLPETTMKVLFGTDTQ